MKIKQLIWGFNYDRHSGSWEHYSNEIIKNTDFYYSILDNNKNKYDCYIHCILITTKNNLEDAKKACQEHYAQWVMDQIEVD